MRKKRRRGRRREAEAGGAAGLFLRRPRLYEPKPSADEYPTRSRGHVDEGAQGRTEAAELDHSPPLTVSTRTEPVQAIRKPPAVVPLFSHAARRRKRADDEQQERERRE